MFVGRDEYLDDLKSLCKKSVASLIACRGRRRIGKSTLFREFARRNAQTYIEIEGLPPRKCATNQDQINAFMTAMANQTGAPRVMVNTWYDAFRCLEQTIDDRKRTVILLDEISWMGTHDPDFPGQLRSTWETFFHRHGKLIMILCGSASAWIKENILDNTGFAGRFSRDYILPELPLSDCVKFWGRAARRINPREIIDVLSVTGGVPRYLEEIDPGLSADENIRRLCFTKEGELFNDFNAMFSEVFGEEAVIKRRILNSLAESSLSGAEIAAKLNLENNGHFARQLRALAESGLITPDSGRNPETGEEARVSRYRLRDNYTRFYLRYVEPRHTEIEVGAFKFASLSALPGWNSILGLQFENLIVNNVPSLLPMLGLGSSLVISAAPYRKNSRTANADSRGFQIDLLIQTARTAYVVEIKRKLFIDQSIETEVENRIRRLSLRKGVSTRAVLVYDGELDPVVEGNGFFDCIIPARRLLGL